jgi:hypothetical protein
MPALASAVFDGNPQGTSFRMEEPPNVALVFKNRPLAQGVFDGLKPKRSAMSECGKAIFPEYFSRQNDSSK